MALGVARQQAAGFGQRGLVMQAGEDVQHLALHTGGVADAVGGDQRKLHAAREFHGGLIARFFVAVEMALQFDVNVVASEDARQAIQSFGRVAVFQAACERAFVATSEADQPFGELSEVLERGGGPFAGLRDFGARAQFHARDEAAEILIAFARFDQQRVAPAVLRRDFRADVGLQCRSSSRPCETAGSRRRHRRRSAPWRCCRATRQASRIPPAHTRRAEN